MIYAVQAGKGGSIKIGFSTSPKDRIKTLSTNVPHTLKPLGVMEGTAQEERALHEQFYEHHVRGEWFRPAPDVLAFVRTMNPWPWPYAQEVRVKRGLMKTPRTRKQQRTRSPKIDLTKPASIVINERFNGLTHFCTLTGYATSTAHAWLIRGYIVPHQKGVSIHAHILAVAAANRIKLLPSDFVELPPAPVAASVSGDVAA